MSFQFGGVSHLKKVLTPEELRKCLREAKRRINSHKTIFDTIVCCGLSGQLFGAPLAYYMKKSVLVVRKKEDVTTHGAKRLEGNYGCKRFIIADDLVDTGDTIKFILTEVKRFCPDARCVGVCLYNTGVFNTVKDLSDDLWRFRGTVYEKLFVPPSLETAEAEPAPSKEFLRGSKSEVLEETGDSRDFCTHFPSAFCTHSFPLF